MSEKTMREEIKALTEKQIDAIYQDIKDINNNDFEKLCTNTQDQSENFKKLIRLLDVSGSVQSLTQDNFNSFLARRVKNLLNYQFGCEINNNVNNLGGLAGDTSCSHLEKMALLLSQYYHEGTYIRINKFLNSVSLKLEWLKWEKLYTTIPEETKRSTLYREKQFNIAEHKFLELSFKNLLYQLEDEN